MIYIQKGANSIQIPKHIDSISVEFDLAIFNKMKFKTEYFERLKNQSNLDLMYEFDDLDFERLDNGEYVYFLYGLPITEDDNIETLETGLLQIGEYKNINKQYETAQEGIQYR